MAERGVAVQGVHGGKSEGVGGRVGCMERAAQKHTHEHVQNREPMGMCYMTQGTQTRLRDNLEGLGGLGAGREALEGGDICISMAYP